MRTSKACQKCGDKNIVKSLPRARIFGYPAKILLPTGNPFRPGDLEAIVCLECGFLELYLTDKGLVNIRKSMKGDEE